MDVFQPRKVLFVDDDDANRLLFEVTIGEVFDVVLASSGAEALTLLEHEPIDVLLTDHRMPGMSGVELCERVAQTHPHVERLLVTAYVDTSSAVAAINQGRVSRYLGKPWDEAELVDAIRQGQANAVRTRLAERLTAEMVGRERATALAALQARVLHDLANATSQIKLGCSELTLLVEPLRASHPALFGDLDQELADMRVAVRYLTELHGRVRGLHRSAEVRPEPLRILDLMHSASRLARPSLPAGGHIEVDGDAALIVYADRTDLGRVLVNLSTNAAQAVAESGTPRARVVLTAESDGPMVRIEVSDNGPGVPADVQQRIFEEHFTTREQGTGIGLFTSRRLVEENGGTLTLEPTGAGACFRIVLPASPSQRPSTAASGVAAAR